jgi:hypothetical protein
LQISHRVRSCFLQLAKGAEKQKCRTCVADAEKAAAEELELGKERKLADARQRLRLAEATGSAKDKLEAATALSALEAQLVTGLKPIKASKGSGRGGAKR